MDKRRKTFWTRFSTTYLVVAVLFSGLPVTVFADESPKADIKVNGSDGPVYITQGDSFSFSWSSKNATACQLTSPAVSGIDLAGNDGPVPPGHPWYPTVGNPTTFSIACTDGTKTSTDSVVVSLAEVVTPPPPPAPVTADIKINGKDGLVTITSGQSYTYSWSSTGATACQLTSPAVSGIDLAGNDGPVTPGHPWYPTASTTVTFTIVCTNGTNTATDSASVRLEAEVVTPPPPPPPAPVTADIKINGKDGLVTITSGQSYTYSWSSTGATACQLTSPAVSGIDLAGNDGPVTPGHPWYPTASTTVTFTIVCTNGTNTATDSASVRLEAEVVTPPPPAPEKKATIVATKIVCKKESDLPNLSGSSIVINENTAKAFLNSNPDCHAESGWQFQWGKSGAKDPGGSFIGEAPSPWVTFPSSTDVYGRTSVNITIPSDEFVWVREVLKSGYQPFTGNSKSAEIYCHTDVLNYDNYDGIKGMKDGHTYYCVAFNVKTVTPPPPPAPVTADIKINGKDGLVTITSGQSYTYSWSSTGATACQLTSPAVSGIDLAGNDGPVTPGHPWYPTASTTVTFTIVCTNGTNTATDSASVRLEAEVVTPPPPAPEKKATIVATKIVCKEESDLPNMSGSSNNINENTAKAFLNSNPDCHAESGWQFQWGKSGAKDPGGSFIGEAPSPWVTFPSSTDVYGRTSVNIIIPSDEFVWVREVLKSGYQPFTGNSKSAEIYCHTDVLNYDNLDGVSGMKDGQIYYCVAFNTKAVVTPPPPPPPAPVTADIKINGKDGLVTITSGQSYTYSWSSTGATACQLTSPAVSGIDLAGNDGPVTPGHPWYPTASTTVTFTIVCTNGTNTATDSASVRLEAEVVPPPPPYCPLPSVTSPLSITTKIGESFSHTITASSSVASSTPTISINTANLPSGLSFSTSTATISGVPTQSGTFHITITVTDPCGITTKTLVLNVTAPSAPHCPLPTISSPLSVNTKVGEPFAYTFEVASSVASSTPTLVVNTVDLPEGLSYSSTTQKITGTPTKSGTFNVSFSVTDPCGTVAKTLVIKVDAKTTITTSTGGGRGRGITTVIPGQVLGNFTFCPYLTQYMRMGAQNDPMQVMRLQAFLKSFEGYDYVTINGIFDQATHQAVSAFQLKYSADILAPWGISHSTGFVYLTTLKKINEIICGPQADVHVPKTIKDIKPIVVHKPAVIHKEGGKDGAGYKEGLGTTTSAYIPLVGVDVNKGQTTQDAGNMGSRLKQATASALLAWPSTPIEAMQCLYEFLLILTVLYIIGTVLENVLFNGKPQSVYRKFLAKWAVISVGLVFSIIGAYIVGEYCLLIPLLIALILSLAWMFSYPKHNSMRASVKSWYLVATARTKSMIRQSGKDKEVASNNSSSNEGASKVETTQAVMVTDENK